MNTEQSLIGLILLDNARIYKVAGKLKPEHFKGYGDLYASCLKLYKADREVSVITLKKTNPDVTVDEFIDMATTDSRDISTLADIILEEYRQREIKKLALVLTEKGKSTKILSDIAERVEDLLRTYSVDRGSLREAMQLYEDWKSDDVKLECEVNKLNQATNGMRRGQVWIVGGRTGSGKSYFVLDFALQQALGGRDVLFFSTELNKAANFKRLLRMYQRYTGIADVEEAKKMLSTLKEMRVYTNITDIDSIVAEATRRGKLGRAVLVVVDHIQDLESRQTNEYERLTYACLRLKDLAVQQNLAVMAVSQLNRSGNAEGGMSFLGTGKIEQIAHLALIINREDSELYKEPKHWLYVTKNRDGGITGKILVKWDFSDGSGTFSGVDN